MFYHCRTSARSKSRQSRSSLAYEIAVSGRDLTTGLIIGCCELTEESQPGKGYRSGLRGPPVVAEPKELKPSGSGRTVRVCRGGCRNSIFNSERFCQHGQVSDDHSTQYTGRIHLRTWTAFTCGVNKRRVLFVSASSLS